MTATLVIGRTAGQPVIAVPQEAVAHSWSWAKKVDALNAVTR